MKFSKKGDGGETSLLGGQRVPKYDLRPETYGTLDEASSALGIAKALTVDRKISDILFDVQKDLLVLGAELAALPGDVENLASRIGAGQINRLEQIIDDLQQDVVLGREFIYPGKTVVSAQIDLARTIIRRAERRAAEMKVKGLISRPEIHSYLNRLADMLFTLARWEETTTPGMKAF
jgi:cob(I)alamin adenosyltransferase